MGLSKPTRLKMTYFTGNMPHCSECTQTLEICVKQNLKLQAHSPLCQANFEINGETLKTHLIGLQLRETFQGITSWLTKTKKCTKLQ